jgi:hypothetical protein
MKLPRKRVVLSLFLFLFFFLLVGGEVLFSREIIRERRTIDDLRTREAILESDVRDKTRLITAYKDTLGAIERYEVNLPANEVAFFSAVERELAKNGVQVNSIKPAKASKGARGVEVDFVGPYYAVLNVMADWRGMGVAVRMDSVSLARDQQEGLVKGKVVLETVLAGEGT